MDIGTSHHFWMSLSLESLPWKLGNQIPCASMQPSTHVRRRDIFLGIFRVNPLKLICLTCMQRFLFFFFFFPEINKTSSKSLAQQENTHKVQRRVMGLEDRCSRCAFTRCDCIYFACFKGFLQQTKRSYVWFRNGLSDVANMDQTWLFTTKLVHLTFQPSFQLGVKAINAIPGEPSGKFHFWKDLKSRYNSLQCIFYYCHRLPQVFKQTSSHHFHVTGRSLAAGAVSDAANGGPMFSW